MFGKAGLGGLMQQAQKMQDNMKKAQAELAQTEVEGQAGNGLVKVKATCGHVVTQLDISPDLIAEAGGQALRELRHARRRGLLGFFVRIGNRRQNQIFQHFFVVRCFGD